MNANSSCSPEIIDKSQKHHTRVIVWSAHIYPLYVLCNKSTLPMFLTTDIYFSPPTFLSLPPTFSPCFILCSTLAFLSGKHCAGQAQPDSACRPGDCVAPLTKCICPLPNDSSATGRLKGGKERGRGSGEEAPVSLSHWTAELRKYIQSFQSKCEWYWKTSTEVVQALCGQLYIKSEDTARSCNFFCPFHILLYWMSFPIYFLNNSLSMSHTHTHALANELPCSIAFGH